MTLLVRSPSHHTPLTQSQIQVAKPTQGTAPTASPSPCTAWKSGTQPVGPKPAEIGLALWPKPRYRVLDANKPQGLTSKQIQVAMAPWHVGAPLGQPLSFASVRRVLTALFGDGSKGAQATWWIAAQTARWLSLGAEGGPPQCLDIWVAHPEAAQGAAMDALVQSLATGHGCQVHNHKTRLEIVHGASEACLRIHVSTPDLPPAFVEAHALMVHPHKGTWRGLGAQPNALTCAWQQAVRGSYTLPPLPDADDEPPTLSAVLDHLAIGWRHQAEGLAPTAWVAQTEARTMAALSVRLSAHHAQNPNALAKLLRGWMTKHLVLPLSPATSHAHRRSLAVMVAAWLHIARWHHALPKNHVLGHLLVTLKAHVRAECLSHDGPSARAWALAQSIAQQPATFGAVPWLISALADDAELNIAHLPAHAPHEALLRLRVAVWQAHLYLPAPDASAASDHLLNIADHALGAQALQHTAHTPGHLIALAFDAPILATLLTPERLAVPGVALALTQKLMALRPAPSAPTSHVRLRVALCIAALDWAHNTLSPTEASDTDAEAHQMLGDALWQHNVEALGHDDAGQAQAAWDALHRLAQKSQDYSGLWQQYMRTLPHQGQGAQIIAQRMLNLPPASRCHVDLAALTDVLDRLADRNKTNPLQRMRRATRQAIEAVCDAVLAAHVDALKTDGPLARLSAADRAGMCKKWVAQGHMQAVWGILGQADGDAAAIAHADAMTLLEHPSARQAQPAALRALLTQGVAVHAITNAPAVWGHLCAHPALFTTLATLLARDTDHAHLPWDTFCNQVLAQTAQSPHALFLAHAPPTHPRYTEALFAFLSNPRGQTRGHALQQATTWWRKINNPPRSPAAQDHLAAIALVLLKAYEAQTQGIKPTDAAQTLGAMGFTPDDVLTLVGQIIMCAKRPEAHVAAHATLKTLLASDGGRFAPNVFARLIRDEQHAVVITLVRLHLSNMVITHRLIAGLDALGVFAVQDGGRRSLIYAALKSMFQAPWVQAEQRQAHHAEMAFWAAFIDRTAQSAFMLCRTLSDTSPERTDLLDWAVFATTLRHLVQPLITGEPLLRALTATCAEPERNGQVLVMLHRLQQPQAAIAYAVHNVPQVKPPAALWRAFVASLTDPITVRKVAEAATLTYGGMAVAPFVGPGPLPVEAAPHVAPDHMAWLMEMAAPLLAATPSTLPQAEKRLGMLVAACLRNTHVMGQLERLHLALADTHLPSPHSVAVLQLVQNKAACQSPDANVRDHHLQTALRLAMGLELMLDHIAEDEVCALFRLLVASLSHLTDLEAAMWQRMIETVCRKMPEQMASLQAACAHVFARFAHNKEATQHAFGQAVDALQLEEAYNQVLLARLQDPSPSVFATSIRHFLRVAHISRTLSWSTSDTALQRMLTHQLKDATRAQALIETLCIDSLSSTGHVHTMPALRFVFESLVAAGPLPANALIGFALLKHRGEPRFGDAASWRALTQLVWGHAADHDAKHTAQACQQILALAKHVPMDKPAPEAIWPPIAALLRMT